VLVGWAVVLFGLKWHVIASGFGFPRGLKHVTVVSLVGAW
jgi:hypothetical protein